MNNIKPIYQNNLITLYQGDCLEIMPNLDIKVNAVISDIPYFQIVKNDWDNQFVDLNNYLLWCNQCFSCCYNLMKDNSNIIIFTGRQYNRFVCSQLDNYFQEKRIIIWNRKKTNWFISRSKCFTSCLIKLSFSIPYNNSFFLKIII